MHQPMRLCGDERAGDLRGDFQREDRGKRALAADMCFDGFALDQLHRVETSAGFGFAKMKDSSHIGMPQLCGGARLATEALARLGISRVSGANDLQRDGRTEIKVLGTVSNTHRSAA